MDDIKSYGEHFDAGFDTTLFVTKEHKDAKMPTKNNEDDAGWDLYADETVTIYPGTFEYVPTGVRITCEKGWYWTVNARSSLGFKREITPYSGVMDAGFTYDTKIKMFNNMNISYTIKKGDKFCQVLVKPVPKVKLQSFDSVQEHEEYFASGRGNKCWGSSGE